MKKFAYFAAVSLVVIAQAASAQYSTRQNPQTSSTPSTTSSTQSTRVVVSMTKEPVKILTVYMPNGSRLTTVALMHGKNKAFALWQFHATSAHPSLNGVVIDSEKLKEGYACVLERFSISLGHIRKS